MRREYAILGFLAEHGPSAAEEVARKLRFKPRGVAMDLAVQEVVWRKVVSSWSAEAEPRKLYRLADGRGGGS